MLRVGVAVVMLCVWIEVNTQSLAITRFVKPSSTDSTVNAGSTCTAVGPNNSTIIGLGNCEENVYIVTLNLGTPIQTFQFQFDTGSDTLWVPTIQPLGFGFNTDASTTYQFTSQTMSIQYADGSGVSGIVGSDFVSAISTNINVRNQILWVNKEQSMSFPGNTIGIVGMGYTTTANFLDNAYNAGQIQSPVFALKISNNTDQSFIYYNNIPLSITQNTIMVDQYETGHWQVEILATYVDGTDYTSSSSNIALIDSGTSYFYLNSQLFKAIQSKYFTTCTNNTQGIPICNCAQAQNWPQFSFMFVGVQVYIEASQYTVNLTQNKCTYNFGTLSTVSNILLGDIFFRSYTITFNKLTSQLGFAGNNIGVVQLIGKGGYLISQYVFLGIICLLVLFGVVLMVKVRYLNPLQPSVLMTDKQSINYQLNTYY